MRSILVSASTLIFLLFIAYNTQNTVPSICASLILCVVVLFIRYRFAVNDAQSGEYDD